MDFIYFLGRFHVLALHLPIALVLTVIVVEWLARKEKYRHLDAAAPFLWGATAITSILTVVLGYMHFSEGGFSGPSATAHRFYGTSVAVVSTIAWVLRARFAMTYQKAQIAFAVVLLVLITLTGHNGGNLTHGDTYLVEYAPDSLRRLAGLDVARAKITDLAMADPYLDIAQPILEQRCVSCHNNDRMRGGLNLSNYEALMTGGDDGPVVVAGDLEMSDLFRRITLPQDHEDFMPAEGKTALTEDQLAIVRWWIATGARTGTTVAEVDVPEDVRPLIVAQLGLDGTQPAQTAAASAAAEQTADPQIVERLAQAGLVARQVSLSDSTLVVSPAAPGGELSDAQVAALESAPAQIVELNLYRKELKDSALSTVGKLTNLSRLRLELNQITDAGVKQLSGLGKLEYLNLYGNEGVTDASVETLAALGNLQEVYLWQTGVTPRGAARLRQLRPDLKVDVGITNDTASRAVGAGSGPRAARGT